MAIATFLQSEILTNFVYPFLLMFFILFAVLEKTKVLGENQKQINALVSLVISLIFIGAVFPKMVVGNLILFLTVSIIVIFVVFLIWGFIAGDLKEGFKMNDKLKTVLMIIAAVAVVLAIIWATGLWGTFFSSVNNSLFKQSWSNPFWTNFFVVVIVAIAVALVIGKKQSS